MRGGRNIYSSGRRRNQMMLRGLVESCRRKHSLSTADDIVHHLQQNNPNYRRMELKTLTRLVNEILLPSSSVSPFPHKRKMSLHMQDDDDDDDDDDDRGGPEIALPRKKRGPRADDEQRLLQIENEYSRRRNRDQPTVSASESDSESQLTPSSTSEDAVFGERVEPEFDLTRSMLRQRYSGTESRKERDIEVDVSTEKDSHKLDMVNGHKEKVGGGARRGKVEKLVGARNEDKGPRFEDLGGMRGVLEELEMEVFVPLLHPHVLQRLGVNPIGGILLHGPPGCGKTKLAHAIANEMGIPFYKISATEVVSGVSGASEENIRDLFNKAYRTAPSIVFIDEIDAIASKRENLQREMERRIVTQLMTCMDNYHKLVQPAEGKTGKEESESDQKPGNILVIGATNRPDAIDPALRRPGRFDREISLVVPDENARVEILSVLTKNCTLEGAVVLSQIARSTPGYVGADLEALVDKAGNLAMRRILAERKSELLSIDQEDSDEWWKKSWSDEEIDRLAITMPDFERAIELVQPSSKREGFSTIPDVKWEDVGGLYSIRNEFNLHIVRRIRYPEEYQKFGVNLETGILLYGPPGCGKTLIAKAVANEAGANFIHIKGPELLNKYVGESELAVRTLFTRARTCSPCVLFFDEVDALTTKRGQEGGWVVERLLNQLLIELDGADQRQGVFVVGATNRPEVMDPAVLRPGRFGKLLYVPLPSPDDRGLILKALSKRKPIDPVVDLSVIGQSQACENLSGADLKKLMDEAAMVALVEASENGCSDEPCLIKATHFEQALSKITPSVSEKQIKYYEIWSKNFKAT